MASIQLSSIVFLSLLAILFLFFIPAYSTSRRALDQTTTNKTGFRITLHRVDYGKNLTKLERLQRGIKRGKHRLQRLNAMALPAKTDSSFIVETPVRAGGGEFLMKLSIGTPANFFSAILDTGSDLIWTQCLPCETCFDQPTPIFDPKKSSSFSKMSCSSNLCAALPQSTCASDGCEYFYAYGDYSSTEGVLSSETFTFDKVSVDGIGFGCGGDNQGAGFNQGAGLVGLGRGPLSLVSQLKEPKFSYCLTSLDDMSKTSSLLMGSLASVNSTSSSAIKKVTTPLIKNPSQPSFYYLSLEGISVGDTLLPIEKDTFALQKDGSGGLIIDSGTTITYLEEKGFDIVKEAFISQMNLPVDKSGSQGLDLCFNFPQDTTFGLEVPMLAFHFKNDAVLELPPENYFQINEDLGVVCLAMGGSSGMSIFGNIQQQNLLVVHDLSEETLSFVPTQCDQL